MVVSTPGALSWFLGFFELLPLPVKAFISTLLVVTILLGVIYLVVFHL